MPCLRSQVYFYLFFFFVYRLELLTTHVQGATKVMTHVSMYISYRFLPISRAHDFCGPLYIFPFLKLTFFSKHMLLFSESFRTIFILFCIVLFFQSAIHQTERGAMKRSILPPGG